MQSIKNKSYKIHKMFLFVCFFLFFLQIFDRKCYIILEEQISKKKMSADKNEVEIEDKEKT